MNLEPTDDFRTPDFVEDQEAHDAQNVLAELGAYDPPEDDDA